MKAGKTDFTRNRAGAFGKISLAQDRGQCRALLNAVMNIHRFRRGSKFMTSCTTISLSMS
jgi:hypothetical protein